MRFFKTAVRAIPPYLVFLILVVMVACGGGGGSSGPAGPSAPDPGGDPAAPEVVVDAGGPYVAHRDTPTITCQATAIQGEAQIASYDWDMGDDTQKSGPTVEHTYDANPAIYEIVLIARSAGGTALAGDTAVARIRASPVASFVVVTEVDERIVGSLIGFDASSSHDGDELGHIAQFQWDFHYSDSFNPKRITSQASTQYRFPREGEYTVALRVVDDDGFESAPSFYEELVVIATGGAEVIIE